LTGSSSLRFYTRLSVIAIENIRSLAGTAVLECCEDPDFGDGAMKKIAGVAGLAALLMASPALIAQDGPMDFHQDYYLGFSQGVYYGLLLAGTEYDVAWCMKSELAYEAEKLGSGGEFQAKLESIHDGCKGSD
jgi:hypothetical protein